jgi:hypothetical protein
MPEETPSNSNKKSLSGTSTEKLRVVRKRRKKLTGGRCIYALPLRVERNN